MEVIQINPEYKYEIRKVVRIVDGDSYFFEVVLKSQVEDYGFGFIETIDKTMIKKFRLRYFDTPEVYRASPEEKLLGEMAKEFVIDELNKADYKEVHSYKDKTGMYGRYIAEIKYRKGGEMLDLGEELKRNGLLKEKV